MVRDIKRVAQERNLDDWLDEIHVVDRDTLDPKDIRWWDPQFQYGVSHPEDGIVALFVKESDAFRWRLDYINRQMNP